MSQQIVMYSASLGQMQTNCYIIMNQDTKEAIVFDPGDEGKRVEEILIKKGATLKAILLTHGHFDHIMAVPYLLDAYGEIPVYLHEDELEVIKDPSLNLCGMVGMNVHVHPTKLVKDQEVMELVGAKIQCIHIPGHTKGGVCYYFEDQGWLISGDTLFQQSIGRTDFPTGDLDALLQGIKKKLFSLPDETVVFSGHTPETTIGSEKKHNPFLM